ncbi:hypothetical protein DV707_06030 [Halobellus limi]|uniref:DUF7282 domain-containing protein n=1 Tax=Halobellus limi TaxID=699433 RepID=A0A4D6H001_9EURY|nr:hypothetical protein DV707_06030 [Halobellus limi]
MDAVNVSAGGFVAIHDSSLLDGAVIESVIGVSGYLEPGLHENVTVTLYDVPGATFEQSALTEDETLVAMPHRDTNESGTYDFVATNGSEDGPYLANASPVVDSANVTVPEQTTGASFTVANLTAPELVERNESVEVSATVANPNDVADTQEVTFRFDGEVLVREDVALEPGESTEFDTTVDTTGVETGTFFHGVYTRESGAAAQLRVVDQIQSFGVSNLTAPANATVGESVSVTATVTNPNEFGSEQSVEYRFDGALIEARDVDVGGEGSATVEFELGTGSLASGTYIHSVFSTDFGESALIVLESPDDGDDADDGGDADNGDADDADDGDAGDGDGDSDDSDNADDGDDADDADDGDDADDSDDGNDADDADDGDDADDADDGDNADGSDGEAGTDEAGDQSGPDGEATDEDSQMAE